MNQKIVEFITGELGETVTAIKAISGGDISQAYKLMTQKGAYFCKLNKESFGLELFQREEEGLSAIADLKCIRTPKIITFGKQEGVSYLLMEYIEHGHKSRDSMEDLGRSLANMHLSKIEYTFGWKRDNYIGKLVQENSWKDNWIEFFVQNRLDFQFKLAIENRYLEKSTLPSYDQMHRFCNNHFPLVSSSLLHGDLWSGNYLISREGIPYLIDPAVYYGHFEVDLAMTELFGGFNDEFYNAYYDMNPKLPGYLIRRDIYQLYYYLVHLNLFGKSYYSPVMATIRKYFQ